MHRPSYRFIMPALTMVALSGLLAGPARALVLTFDPVNANFERVDQAYGDRVTMTPQDGFSYGTDGGFAPNVVVDYGLLPQALPSLWTVGYGDLTNILFEDQDGYGYLEVTLTADPSWNVELHRFDMAAYSTTEPINSVSVRDGSGNVLFTLPNATIAAAGHTEFAFDPPLQAQVIVIAVDSHNLGSHSDDIGVDNIEFSQVNALSTSSATWGAIKAQYSGALDSEN